MACDVDKIPGRRRSSVRILPEVSSSKTSDLHHHHPNRKLSHYQITSADNGMVSLPNIPSKGSYLTEMVDYCSIKRFNVRPNFNVSWFVYRFLVL